MNTLRLRPRTGAACRAPRRPAQCREPGTPMRSARHREPCWSAGARSSTTQCPRARPGLWPWRRVPQDLFSPKSRAPASKASTSASMGCVLLMGSRRTSSGLRPAARRGVDPLPDGIEVGGDVHAPTLGQWTTARRPRVGAGSGRCGGGDRGHRARSLADSVRVRCRRNGLTRWSARARSRASARTCSRDPLASVH